MTIRDFLLQRWTVVCTTAIVLGYAGLLIGQTIWPEQRLPIYFAGTVGIVIVAALVMLRTRCPRCKDVLGWRSLTTRSGGSSGKCSHCGIAFNQPVIKPPDR